MPLYPMSGIILYALGNKPLNLRNDTSFVICPADKGGAVTVQDYNVYKTEILSQLNDQTFYKRLTKKPTEQFLAVIEQTVTEGMCNGDLTQQNLTSASACPFISMFSVAIFAS